jgi:hypothetical protein
MRKFFARLTALATGAAIILMSLLFALIQTR